MIVTKLNAVAYRVHDPKWAFTPASGAGAGRHGGRANRPGVNALYLSLELETALAEYKQTDALLEPALMVGYQISVESVVDFRSGFRVNGTPCGKTSIATGVGCISMKASSRHRG